jgi:hypothetical protein
MFDLPHDSGTNEMGNLHLVILILVKYESGALEPTVHICGATAGPPK